jgi:hypothetical protein
LTAPRAALGLLARPVRAHPWLFALTAVWAFAPLAHLIFYVGSHGGVLTGANGLDPYDQLAYLAWIRDSRDHLLASNLWQLGLTPHDYLHPMFVLSGLVARLGVSVQLAYLMWKPVAVVVMFGGFSAYVRHLMPGRRRAQSAALLLALFYETPVLALADWTGRISPNHRFDLLLTSDDANSALNLWGFDHTAIAIGLMPVCLIAIDRLRSAPTAGAARRWTLLATAAGALVSWLHPWQGAMLLLAIGGLLALGGSRRKWSSIAAVAVATALPLLYGAILARADPSWHMFQQHTLGTPPGPAWALLASLGPLAALALLGLRRPRRDREWLLVLWIMACAAVYFLVPQFPPHALSGITLPLSILAVRGWGRMPRRLPAKAKAALAIAAILVATVPAAAYLGQQAWNDVSNPVDAYVTGFEVLGNDQAAALRFIAGAGGRGGVLATAPLALSVPGLTGHPSYNGHFMWETSSQTVSASTFFGLATPLAERRAILRASGVEFLIYDCRLPSVLMQAAEPLMKPAARFGCTTVMRRVR